MGLIICSKLVRVHMSQYIDQTELCMIRYFTQDRSSRPEVFLGKGVLKICSKFTGEHPCRSVISIKLQSSFIEIALRHGCSSVNLLHIFRTPFPKNTSWWLFLKIEVLIKFIHLVYFVVKMYFQNYHSK